MGASIMLADMEEGVECRVIIIVFFFKQKTAYEILTCDWSSDVCSSDLVVGELGSLAIIQFLLLTKTLTVSLFGLAVS